MHKTDLCIYLVCVNLCQLEQGLYSHLVLREHIPIKLLKRYREVTQQQSKGWLTNPTERVTNFTSNSCQSVTSQKMAWRCQGGRCTVAWHRFLASSSSDHSVLFIKENWKSQGWNILIKFIPLFTKNFSLQHFIMLCQGRFRCPPWHGF